MYRYKDTLAKLAGRLGISWARDPTGLMERLSYEEGVREGRRRSPGSIGSSGEPETFGDAIRAAFGDTTFGRANRFLATLGAVGGFGFGFWQAFTLSSVSGLGSGALTVFKWTAIGTVGGALFLMALVAAASLALLYGILMALGLLLNFLASL